jgi:tetratricopeptide (TPR) repeat protein
MAAFASIRPGHPRPWIVSPWWDLTYLVLTPVVIVPAVVLAARYWLSAEQLYLAVISFASLGHHLPGFMRAYGDRELFARFRWRFLLAPPLVFSLALIFTPPEAVRSALDLPWQHLHGMELILLIWGTWHGLMQTYGFMRIYDLRQGNDDRTTALLDQALCISMFTAGVVFSDTRMFGIAGAMWQTGLPMFTPGTLSLIRWLVGAGCMAVLLAYGLNLIAQRRRGVTINGVKLLLAAVTGWFYWYCGRLSTNLLIGIAMFEIYHAVQYNAIVWTYNRRLFERSSAKAGPLGFLFRDRAAMLGLYLAAIAAYSSIRFFTAHTGDRMFSGDIEDAQQWLIAAFVTSSFLHFYYDGFIWKVRDQSTRRNLAAEPAGVDVQDRLVPGVVHAGKWAVLIAIMAMLIASEQNLSQAGDSEAKYERMLQALAELTPDVPEAKNIASELRAANAERRYQMGLDLLKRGDAQHAMGPLRDAIELDPTHYSARLQLGDALLALNKLDAAAQSYQQGIALRPQAPEAYVGLADAYLKSNRPDAAEATLREGLAKKPDSPELCFTLGLLLEHLGRRDEAAALLERAGASGLKATR